MGGSARVHGRRGHGWRVFSCVGSARTGAGVVLVDGGRETEAAGEEARGGVDAHDLRWEDVDRSSASVIASMRRFGGPGGRSGSRPVFVRCLRVNLIPKWPRRRAPAASLRRDTYHVLGEPMDQSALTDTSRLTATTCDRERGHAGQLSGITLHTKTRATLGLGAMGTFRPRADGALGRGARAHLLGVEGLALGRELGADGGRKRWPASFQLLRVLIWFTDEGVAADFGKTRANPSRKIHSARPHPIRMRRDFQRVARFRIHMGIINSRMTRPAQGPIL